MITLKTKEDIAILREGGKRHAFIVRELAKMVKPGISTLDLELAAKKLIEEGGDKSAVLGYKPRGAKRPFPANICVSINVEVVHGIPTENERVLVEGDIVTIDVSLTHKGLITDMAVTVPVGKIDPEVGKLLNITEKALKEGIKAAKGGNKVSDISLAIQRIGVANRYGIVEELTGHGVGYNVHEDPYVPNYVIPNRKSETLKPGMVLAIEPMFTLGSRAVTLDDDGYTIRTADGSMSAHFEHTVLITKSGAEILTV